MIIYLFIIFIAVCPGLIFKNRGHKVYLIWAFLVLVLFSALRGDNVGGDLINYIPYFHHIDKIPWSQLLDNEDKYGFIFRFIVKLSCVVSSNDNWILFIISVINISGPLFFIKKFSRIPWFSVFLYITLAYYTNTFNSLRSSMALSVGLFGITALMENKRTRSLILFAAAIEIHKTIFPILGLFFLFRFRPTFWKITTPIVASIVISNALGYTGIKGIIELYFAMNNYGDTIEESQGAGYSLLLLDIIVTFGSYYCLRNRINNINSQLIWLMTFATCIQAMAPLYSYITRIALFFSIAIINLIPNVISTSFVRQSRLIIILCIGILCIWFFDHSVLTPVKGSITNSQGTIPYTFFWE